MMIFNKMFLACTLSKRSELIGFCVLFCQYQQETVGASIYTLVKSVFNGSDIPNQLNKTFIILITRTNQPSYLKIYHLIRLSTVIYKTIIKIMANRLKTIIPDVIVLTQMSFVLVNTLQRTLSLITWEIIHTMQQEKEKFGQMLIKVDLEKAYDQLSWEFIYETLREVNLPTELIRLTTDCISSTTMQVLWNGEYKDYFPPSRGIRKGDPISPYIFVLCIERLKLS